MTYIAQREGGAISPVDLSIRCKNAVVAYIKYLGNIFWPSKLAIYYPHTYKVEWIPVILCGLLLVAITVIVLWQIRRRKYLAVGWFWFLGTLVPVIGLVQVGGQSMADRYTYVPAIGITIAVTWLACDLSAKWRYRKLALGLAGSVIIGLFSVLTFSAIRPP